MFTLFELMAHPNLEIYEPVWVHHGEGFKLVRAARAVVTSICMGAQMFPGFVLKVWHCFFSFDFNCVGVLARPRSWSAGL